MNIIQIPCANHYFGRGGQAARYIILHGTAGQSSAQDIATYFNSTRGTNNPVSSHYIIGTDGIIVQCVQVVDSAWGNGVLTVGHDSWWSSNINPNLQTISIEHCKPDSLNASALTPAQEAASHWLVNMLCTQNNIPRRWADAAGGITGHFSIDPVNRSQCPGTYNFDALYSYLNGQAPSTPSLPEDIVIELTTPGVSPFFSPSADGYWRCNRNQHRVGGDILSFYKRFGNQGLCGLTYLGLPLGEEFVPKVGTSAQEFERGIVIRDPNRVVEHIAGLPSTEHCYLASLTSGFGHVLLVPPAVTQPIPVPVPPPGNNAAVIADAIKNLVVISEAGDELIKAGNNLKTSAAAAQHDLQGVH